MVTARVYLIGALVLACAFLGLGGGLLYYRAEAATQRGLAQVTQAQLDTAKTVNDIQAAAIDRLAKLREADDALLRDVRDRLGSINTATQATTEAVANLERSNADVKAFLGMRLPPDLRCVLTPNANGCATADSQRLTPGVAPK